MAAPDSFAYRVVGDDVLISHHGRPATTLRGATAKRFLADVETALVALGAIAVGTVFGLTYREMAESLAAFRPVAGRCSPQVSDGIQFIDDTYNASPESVIAALNLLKDLDGRRVAVLGDMLELGPAEERSHRLVGRRVKGVAHILVTVGARGRLIAEEALLDGMEADRVYSVDKAQEALPLLKSLIEAQDVILVKGSRAVELDQIVAALSQRETVSQI